MLRYIAKGCFAGIVVHSDCVMGYCLAIIRFQISVLHHSVRIEEAVVRMGELYLITGLNTKLGVQEPQPPATAFRLSSGSSWADGILFIVFSSFIVNDQLRS